MLFASRVMGISKQLLADREGGVFVSRALRDRLPAAPWHDRLRAQPLGPSQEQLIDSAVYRLGDP
jgi:class 3 adenylate cyclase